MKNILAPIVGIVIGFMVVLWAITSAGTLSAFIDLPSLMITLFGSMAALFISFPLDAFLSVPKSIRNLFGKSENRVDMVKTLVEFSRDARRNGILSIEEDLAEQDNEMLVSGLQMIIDGKDGETIQDFLELKMGTIESDYQVAPRFLNKWGEFAPAFGMVGTLTGLIIMLGELDDPSTIGSGMATALITTLYGTILANLIFIPLASNLEGLAADKLQINEIILEGILSLQEGQNPRDIEEKLKTFLSPAEVIQYDSSSPEAAADLGRQEG